MEEQIERLYKQLSVKEIAGALTQQGFQYGTQVQRNKRKFIQRVFETGNIDILEDVAARKRQDQERKDPSKKRRTAMDVDTGARRDCFMEVPTRDEMRELYRDFYQRTSNEALKLTVCAVCGRQRTQSEWRLTEYRFPDIPNRHRLRPQPDWRGPDDAKLHGLLLSPAGCQLGSTENKSKANICGDCSYDLTTQPREGQPEQPPKYAYANGLWYGSMPEELEGLTLPERLLIAQAYPRAYVVKLYPKRGRYDPETLNIALSGNVTAFELNMEDRKSVV